MDKIEEGFAILDVLEEQDHIVGSAKDTWKPLVETKEEWVQYYSDHSERQNLGGGFDSYSCCNFHYLRPVETIFNIQIDKESVRWITEEDIQWLKDKGYAKLENGKWRVNFSDRFNAITSGTVPRLGNSGRTVALAGRNIGLIPQDMLPFTQETKEDEYFDENEITQEMWDLADAFQKRFDIGFKFLNPNVKEQYDEWVLLSPFSIYICCGCPWVAGVQQKCFNTTNHCVTDLGIEDTDEKRYGDTYYRKQKDNTYKLYRRVAKDFVVYNLGYVYTLKSKSLTNNEEDMKFIQEEGDKNIYLDTGNGTKQMVVDMDTKDALEGKSGNGTLVWVPRIID